MYQLRSFYLALTAVALLSSTAASQTVSFSSLLDEMINRENLAKFPSPAYKCAQASSYDRGSVAPGEQGWFANMDRSHFVRTEETEGGTEYVLMDEKGPGAIVRIWATWHGARRTDGNGLKPFSNGTIRFYLDGNPEPAIEGPITEIIDKGGLVKGPLAQSVSPETDYGRRGHNLYLPIPYARSCKVTYETSAFVDEGARRGEALYYQINYRTYEPGTQVKTFQMEQLETASDKIDQVQQQLVGSGIDETGLEKVSFAGRLRAGETRTVTLDQSSTVDQPGTGQAGTVEQGGAIRQLTVKLKADDLAQALRSTVLRMKFDGDRTVWCPVGAFFGRGYQSEPHQTWYTRVTEDGAMSCFWVMPYQKQCQISLVNLSEQPVEVVQGEALVGDWQWDHRSMHFHSTWKQLTEVSSFREGADQPGEGAYDVNFVEIDGKGVYVGDTLTLFNGANAWWGEGDEKIYVDHEEFPSHIGTGTEDYYGYAWARPEFFQAPFHAQPTGAGNLRAGYTVNSRYRALDAIPFNEALKFDMEMWHWHNTTVNYAPATFWYARPSASWNVEPAPETAAKPVVEDRREIVEIFRVKGAIEGESLEIVEKTGGTTEDQTVARFGWSNETQLWWMDADPGDQLVLEFPVEEAGQYEVIANLTKAIDYAIVSVKVNDGEPKKFDRFNEGVAHDKLSLGTYQLSKGPNRLTVTIEGANEKAVKRHMFGLDYLQLIPK